MSVPWRVDDGNFSSPIAVGQPEISYPFADEGDQTSAIFKQKYRQNGQNFNQLPAMSVYSGYGQFELPDVSTRAPNSRTIAYKVPGGYLVGSNGTDNWRFQKRLGGTTEVYDIRNPNYNSSLSRGIDGRLYLVDEGPTRDIGHGIIEWWRTYATVPITRVVGGTIAYTEQFGIANGEITETTLTKNARITWEYGLSPFDISYAPKIVTINGIFLFIGDWSARIAKTNFLAADQETGIYRGGIYYRKSIRVDAALDFQGSPT